MFKFDSVSTKRFWFLTFIILAVALVRLINLPIDNFSPIAAIALFGAAYFRNRLLGLIIPLVALLISDLLLEMMRGTGFYTGWYWVYGSFALVAMIGYALKNNVKPVTVLAGSLTASVLFFLITNFGSWLANPFYIQNFGGLMMSYELGLPFFRNTMIGDLVYCAILFGAFEFAQRRMGKLQEARIYSNTIDQI